MMFYRTIRIAVLSFLFTVLTVVQAQQRIVALPAEADLVKFVNDDAAARTAFLPGQTIYELQRDGYYVCRSSLTTLGYHLYIRAAAGTGPKPIIRPGSPDGVGTGSRVFFPGDDMTLRNVYLANKDDLGNLINNGIRLNVAGKRIVIDSCHLDYDVQSLIRLDASNCKVFISNSIVSNLGNNNGLNGRIVDTRSNNQDTIVLRNNIVYNVAEKLLRTAGAVVKYIRFDHNTMVNCTDGRVDFGPVVNGVFTNNLLYNCAYAGNDSTSTGGLLIAASVAGNLEVRNNNMYLHPDVAAAFPKTSGGCYPLAPYSRVRFLDTAAARIAALSGTMTGNDSLAVVLKSAPNNTAACMLDFNSTCILAPNKKDPDMGTGVKIDFEPHYVFDFTYSTSSPLYTRGDGGTPVGSLLEWKIPLSVQQHRDVPVSYQMVINYPNPFNPTTTIEYEVPVRSMTTLTVTDILGRTVSVLVHEVHEPGRHTAVFHADRAVSGIYFATLSTATGTTVTKMLLMK